MAGNQSLIVEIKSVSEEGSFSGLLSTYGNVDEAGDICEPGCFDRTVAESGIRRPFLWQHDQREPIGHLNIVDTKDALSIEGKFNLDTQRGREGYSLLKNGDIDGLSIGYIAKEYHYDEKGIRHLTDVELFEGSLVSIPCNPQARAQAKARRMEIMSVFAECKFLTLLSDEDRSKALAELDAIWERKSSECSGDDKPEEKEMDDPEDDDPEEERMDDDSEEELPDDESKSMDQDETADEADDDDFKKLCGELRKTLDEIISKLEA